MVKRMKSTAAKSTGKARAKTEGSSGLMDSQLASLVKE